MNDDFIRGFFLGVMLTISLVDLLPRLYHIIKNRNFNIRTWIQKYKESRILQKKVEWAADTSLCTGCGLKLTEFQVTYESELDSYEVTRLCPEEFGGCSRLWIRQSGMTHEAAKSAVNKLNVNLTIKSAIKKF